MLRLVEYKFTLTEILQLILVVLAYFMCKTIFAYCVRSCARSRWYLCYMVSRTVRRLLALQYTRGALP